MDERKMTILKAIIRNYLETGEPVGSRTISKYTDLQLSSATIRNEMADLEELGYIFQPHTSAGRIPTDKGYRLYVDWLMEEKEKEREAETGANGAQNNGLLLERVDKLEQLLRQMAKVLAANTNYATLISAPQYHRNKVKFIQLSRVEECKILMVVMMEGNRICNTVVEAAREVNEEEVTKVNLLLNSMLCGLSLEEINLALISRMKKEAHGLEDILEIVLGSIADTIRGESEDPEIYTSGATNILRYPELTDQNKATELIGAFEEKSQFQELITTSLKNDNPHGIQIYIGQESQMEQMKDCSVVTANYQLEEGVTGIIGIVGPKRMDYEKVVATLRSLMGQLDTIYHHQDQS